MSSAWRRAASPELFAAISVALAKIEFSLDKSDNKALKILPFLVEESRLRTMNEKTKRFETSCQFCGELMKIQELESDDAMPFFHDYALVCSCGARGPRIEYKEIFK